MAGTYDKPFRLRVLTALTDALQQITPAAGYDSDLTGKVFRGRLVYGDKDPLPMVSVLEAQTPIDHADADRESSSRCSWQLIIQGFCHDDPRHPTDRAYFLAADVTRRLAEETEKVNDGDCLGFKAITGLSIGSPTVRPPDDLSAKAYFYLVLTIEMVEDLTQPYE